MRSQPGAIDVEAHYLDAELVALLRGRGEPPREAEAADGVVRMHVEPSAPDVFQERSGRLGAALLEVGERRLAAMDAAGIDVQLLSLNLPGCEQFPPAEGAALARERNDLLAELTAAHPERFAGLAALCPDPERPEQAADELERCVRRLGFRGWKVNSHVRDGYLDDPRYLPLLERAAALGAPVYLHPTVPHGSMVGPYTGYGQSLPGPMLGFAAETALHAVRLILGGVFDRCPGLRLVLGHLGEGLPFWLHRLDFEFSRPWLARSPLIRTARRPSEVVREHVWASTSGQLQETAFALVRAELGVERLLLGTDFPYEDAAEAVAWVSAQLPDADERELVLRGNAAGLFALD